MIYVVHPEQWKFFLCAAGTAALVAGVLYYVKNLDPAEMNEINFRLVRIRAWLFPYEYEQGKAYQSLQGLYAIGSGGLWGKGLGNSIQKLGKIPEPYNDYIFAIICEELGIFGAGLIILLFIYLLYRLYQAGPVFANVSISRKYHIISIHPLSSRFLPPPPPNFSRLAAYKMI